MIWIASALLALQGWCGYTLIDGLPLSPTEIEAISGIAVQGGEAWQQFQTRFNLSGDAVIVEACFTFDPTREAILYLIDQSSSLTFEQLDQAITYTRFEGTYEQSAESVRAYLSANISAWEINE